MNLNLSQLVVTFFELTNMSAYVIGLLIMRLAYLPYQNSLETNVKTAFELQKNPTDQMPDDLVSN